METNDKLLLVIALLGLVISIFGMTFIVMVQSNTATTIQQPYQLTLVISTENVYNATVGTQPSFFVLNNGELQPITVIQVPAYRWVLLTIINYDDGNATVPLYYGQVTGTKNNTISVIENSIINATNINTSTTTIQTGAETVNSLPLSIISHTFTVPDLHLNIPIAVRATEQAYIYFGQPGTYNCRCMVACGFGPTGWEGAMSTNGWMQGILEVI